MNDYFAIKELFEIIKNDSSSEIKCDRISLKMYDLSITKRINEHSNYSLRIRLNLDIDMIWKEYCKLPETKKYQEDFSSNERIINTLIERKFIEILNNLKVFNSEIKDDNYFEIAKLVDITFFTSTGKNFGL